MGHCGGASADPRREPAAYPVQTQEHQEERAGSSRPSSQDALLQAVTGLRISEASNVQWKHVIEHGDHLLIDATRDIVKGRKGSEKGRHIPILREDVADYLRSHREDDDHYVIGYPSSTTKPRNPTNADDVVPEFYRQVAEATDVALLADLRSHSWRATLHGVYADKIDPPRGRLSSAIPSSTTQTGKTLRPSYAQLRFNLR